MRNPIIAIDVSKDSSHAQLFESHGKPLGKPFVFDHDRRGLDELKKRLDDLKKTAGEDVTIALEPTGNYHMPIARWCSKLGIPVCPISPIESGKLRNAQVRGSKTDSLDCANIANAYYGKEEFTDINRDKDAMQLARWYERVKRLEIATKCMFTSCFDPVFPTFTKKFGDQYSDKWFCVIAHYGHPEKILSAGKETVANLIHRKTRHSEAKSKAYAAQIIEFCRDCVSGFDPDSPIVEELKSLAGQISSYEEKASELLERMRERISQDQYRYVRNAADFKQDRLLTLILAEIGDISRFKSSRSLVSYAGLDPVIHQSGQMTGKGLGITKKGNTSLRKYLYMAVRLIITHDKKSPISEFYAEKKSDGKPPKVALIACCGKLLRTIHAALTLQEKFVRSNG